MGTLEHHKPDSSGRTPDADQNDRNGLSDRSFVALGAVAEAVARLRYGAVHLTIHDGRVVQLDVTERQRFT